MPVLNKTRHHDIMLELSKRYDALLAALEPRALKSATEGVNGRGSWINPELKCATEGDGLEVRLAVEDFKTILAEVKALK